MNKKLNKLHKGKNHPNPQNNFINLSDHNLTSFRKTSLIKILIVTYKQNLTL